MRIAFITSGFLHSSSYPFSQGGVQSQILGLSRRLVELGHEIQIIGCFREGSLDDLNEEIKMGINFIDVKSLRFKCSKVGEILSRLIYSYKVSKLIRNLNPDVVYLGDYYSAYFPSKLHIPKIYVTHNVDAFPFFREFDVKNNFISCIYFFVKNKLESKIMHRVDTVIALNSDIEDYLQKEGIKNVYYIPNGIDSEKYYNNPDGNFILYGGRFHKVKGIEYLIQAYSEICDTFNIDLRLVGGGPEEEYLKKLVKSKMIDKKVKFIPFLDKKQFNECLSKCSVFVLPSLYETFGVVMLEAMASSKPVIVSNISGPKDVIKHGYNGFFFEKANVEDLRKCLEFCLSYKDKTSKIGKQAMISVQDQYDFKKITQAYLDIFEEIIDKRLK